MLDMIGDFPGKFRKAVEQKGKPPLTLTIKDVAKEVMDDGKVKPVLYFEEDECGLVLNVTNRTDLVDRFGRKSDDWIGKKVTLTTQRVQGPNGMADGIRFVPPTDGPDDEVPSGGDDDKRGPDGKFAA